MPSLLYDEPMIAARGGPNIFALDSHASEQDAPYLIYTADGSDPREIDDGIAVEPLPSASEVYRVRVCMADTSPAYLDDRVVRVAQDLVEARYLSPADDQPYTPLLPLDVIRRRELRADRFVKSAMIVSYVVGQACPPTDVDIQFGTVEVVENLTYTGFGSGCRYGQSMAAVARAAVLTRSQTGVNWDNKGVADEIVHDRPMTVPARHFGANGAKITSTFMVGACHLAGKFVRDHDIPAIYRVHNPADTTLNEFLDSSVAHFSLTPGLHANLGVDPYCRLTSPLRRLEDFVMCGILKAYHAKREIGTRDERIMLETIRALNQRIAHDQRRSRHNQTEAWMAQMAAKQESALLNPI